MEPGWGPCPPHPTYSTCGKVQESCQADRRLIGGKRRPRSLARGAAHGRETPGAARQPPRGDAQPGRLGSPCHVPGETRSRHMQAPAQRLNGDEKARRLLPENKEAAAELGVGKTLRCCPRGSLRRQQDADGLHRSYSPPRAPTVAPARPAEGGRRVGRPRSPPRGRVGWEVLQDASQAQDNSWPQGENSSGLASLRQTPCLSHLGVTTVRRHSRGESAAGTRRASFMARGICGAQHRAGSRVDLVVVVTPG